MNNAKIKRVLLEAAEKAGALLKSKIGKIKKIEKKTELSLVTEIDKGAEKIIIDILRRNFPDHAILTEESPPMGNSESRWIIDPLDGTTNFAHAFPVACVSIAYEHQGKLVMGAVFDPFRGELFFGERGRGAFLNGKRIHVSKTPSLRDSLLCTGFPYDRREQADGYLAIFKDFMMKVQGIRRTGAAALDLCYVACGRFDGFWELKLQSWDKAAAMVIIDEAGGRTTNFQGAKLSISDIQNLATNNRIHKEMLSVLKPYKKWEGR